MCCLLSDGYVMVIDRMLCPRKARATHSQIVSAGFGKSVRYYVLPIPLMMVSI